MKVTLKTSGNFKEKLTELSNRAKALDGKHQVMLKDLMSPAFIAGCSTFSSIEELFAASNFKIEAQGDLDAIPEDQLDAFVSNHTSYGSCSEMKHAAIREWTKSQLGL